MGKDASRPELGSSQRGGCGEGWPGSSCTLSSRTATITRARCTGRRTTQGGRLHPGLGPWRQSLAEGGSRSSGPERLGGRGRLGRVPGWGGAAGPGGPGERTGQPLAEGGHGVLPRPVGSGPDPVGEGDGPDRGDQAVPEGSDAGARRHAGDVGIPRVRAGDWDVDRPDVELREQVGPGFAEVGRGRQEPGAQLPEGPAGADGERARGG